MLMRRKAGKGPTQSVICLNFIQEVAMETTARFVYSSTNHGRLGGIASGVIWLTMLSNLVPADAGADPEVKAQVQANYGKLPLNFEINQGQTDAQVKFLSRGSGYTLFLTPTEAVVSLNRPKAHHPKLSSLSEFFSPSLSKSLPFSEESGTVLRMQFVGSTPAPQILGEEALPGRVNYLIGKEPNQWLRGIPTFAKVTYQGIYPGVDLVYYGKQGQLEYDFVVAPGADPGQIKLAFQGADYIGVNRGGELELHAGTDELRMRKPAIYQEIDGVRKPIDGRYVVEDGQEVGFQMATYDTTRPLIIDPVLTYSTYLGGSGEDEGFSIAVDRRGQAYVTGQTNSTDFPTQNALQPINDNSSDVFVVQLTADGRSLRYLTYLGGSKIDQGFGIAVDQRGCAYITGRTLSPDFPIMNALHPFLGSDFDDAFVAKLSADGSALRYSTYLGGEGDDQGSDITVDQRGRAYVTGWTSSPNFPTVNAFQSTLAGARDAFIAQFSPNGRSLRYATYLGGAGEDYGSGIAVGRQGRAYVTGGTRSFDFPIVKALQPSLGGVADAFVAQFSAGGNALRYSTYLGGSDGEGGSDIAVDQRDRAYVTGPTLSLDFPTLNALQPHIGGGVRHSDAFVSQLTADGAALKYSTYLGGSGFEVGSGIAVDRWGHALVTGSTELGGIPIVNAVQPIASGYRDAFVAKFAPDGATLRYSTYLGGRGDNVGHAIAVDQRGHAYVTGRTISQNFPTKNSLQPASGGGSDAFVTKIESNDRP
jgi:hypothetical protein